MKDIKSIEKELKNLEVLLLNPGIRKSVSELSKILADDAKTRRFKYFAISLY